MSNSSAAVCVRQIRDILENHYLDAMVGVAESPDVVLAAIEAQISKYRDELAILEAGESQ